MRALVVTIAALTTISIASTALAQQRTVRDMVNDLKARHGQTFEQCQALATSRGYIPNDDDEAERQ